MLWRIRRLHAALGLVFTSTLFFLRREYAAEWPAAALNTVVGPSTVCRCAFRPTFARLLRQPQPELFPAQTAGSRSSCATRPTRATRAPSPSPLPSQTCVSLPLVFQRGRRLSVLRTVRAGKHAHSEQQHGRGRVDLRQSRASYVPPPTIRRCSGGTGARALPRTRCLRVAIRL